MKQSPLLFSPAMLLGAILLWPSQVTQATPEKLSPDSVSALIERVTPRAASQFVVEPLAGATTDTFELAGKDGQVVLRGSTPVAQASAYGWYLKHVAGAHLSWNGDQLNLPAKLKAPAAPIRITTPYEKRFAFNYCTLSYSGAFWDWNRWQREVDFETMNGFNQMLVTAGVEKVWQKTLRDLGYPEERIRAFIPSPAYAAWWHMGNLEGAGGPISDAQIENEVKMGQQIVTRLRGLGVTPVLPGFVGILPRDIGQYLPELKDDLIEQGDWDGYARPIVLKPTSKDFGRIAAIWYKNLNEVYGGPIEAYGGDLFHEGGRTGGADVTKAATAVQTAMQTASPGAKWVVQGWQGNPQPQLLAGLDPKFTEILQLSLNMNKDGRPLRTYDGQPWLWCELANFGARNGLFGGVPLAANLPSYLLDPAKKRGNMKGIGLLSEGIEQNPLYYDLFFDSIWRDKNVNLDSCLDGYATRRYGSQNATAQKAVKTLIESGVYSPPLQGGITQDGATQGSTQDGVTESILSARPAPGASKSSSWSSGLVYYDTGKVALAAQELLQAAPQLKAEATYRYDLVDWTRQVMSDLARPTLANAMAAYDQKDSAAFNRYSNQYLDLLRDSDRLLASDPNFLLGTWISRARAKGTTPEEKARLEGSARALVTTWSGKNDVLDDYSHRQWSGLMGDYYLPRWQAFFDDYRAVLDGKKPASQLDNWYAKQRGATDVAWGMETKIYPTQPQGDAVAIATELLAKYAPMASAYAKIEASAKTYPWKLAPGISTFTFNVDDAVLEAGTIRTTFQWKNGESALKISTVALYEGDKKIAEDAHEGWTGIDNHGNAYTFKLPKFRAGHDSYTIQAQISGASSTDSAGILKVVNTEATGTAKAPPLPKDFPWKLANGTSTLNFDVNEAILENGFFRATLQWKGGQNALKISSVALYEGDKKVAEDTHAGYTGARTENNVYFLRLPKFKTGTEPYSIRAQVAGDGGSDSSGILTVAGSK